MRPPLFGPDWPSAEKSREANILGDLAELRKVLDVLGALGLAVELVVAPGSESEDDDPFASLFEDES